MNVEYNSGLIDIEKLNIYDNIDNIHNLWMEYEMKVKEYTFLRDIIKQKFLHKVVSSDYDGIATHIESYIFDKTKRNFLKIRLNDLFGKYKWDLKNIMVLGGYGGYGFAIPFTINDKKYRLEIPHYNNLTVDNMAHIYYGKYAIIEYESKNIMKTLFCDYSTKKISEYLQKLAGE